MIITIEMYYEMRMCYKRWMSSQLEITMPSRVICSHGF